MEKWIKNSHRYDDIIDLPHPVSKTHPQMALQDRTAQFAPFAALTEYQEAIEKKEEAQKESGMENALLYLTANYGIYADKERVVYTAQGEDIHAQRCEGVFAKLPKGWYAYENCYGQSLIKDPDGVIRSLPDILTSDGKNPALAWYDNGAYRRITLELEDGFGRKNPI